jgi:hypothetical protein
VTVARIMTGFGLLIVDHMISALRPPGMVKVTDCGERETTVKPSSLKTSNTADLTALVEVVLMRVDARSFAPRPPTPTAGPHPATSSAKPPEIHALRFIGKQPADLTSCV